LCQSDRKLGIIRKHRTYANEDRVVHGTKVVGENLGLGATYGKRISRSKGDASVKALGIAYGYEWKPCFLAEVFSEIEFMLCFAEYGHFRLPNSFAVNAGPLSRMSAGQLKISLKN
jgi:hypothetical protein